MNISFHFYVYRIIIKEEIQMSPGQCAARENQLDSAGFLCISSSGTGSPACCGPPYGDLVNIFKCTPNYAQLTDSLITESSASGYVSIKRNRFAFSRLINIPGNLVYTYPLLSLLLLLLNKKGLLLLLLLQIDRYIFGHG